MAKSDGEWKQTACILCSVNCGILVETGGADGREITRVRGDKAHPGSKGYTCNKVLQVNYYQTARNRLASPLRRRADGDFEAIDWDTAIREIAGKFKAIADEYGGDKIFYYGGGGQGNHLGGGYAGALRRALGSSYRSNALAQEKTGLSWVFERTVGGFYHGDFGACEVAFIIGKNPWHSHGFPRARATLRQISRDPARKLIVVDPRVTETAELADIHLRVRPGRDAWLLAAILGELVQRDLVDHSWLGEHAPGHEPVLEALAEIPVADYADYAGVPMAQVAETAAVLAAAESASVLEDLGIEMAPNSTLNSYHTVLLFLLTGNFGKPGAVNLPSQLVSIFSQDKISAERDARGHEINYKTSPVTGARIISGLLPCNLIPDEIVTEHPDRFRAMLVESANPVHSLADAKRMREAMAALDLLVVIDVAMTETAQEADYVLPAASQYEKPELTFFNFEFPDNMVHLRHPVVEALPGTLPEPEIHARLIEATGAFPAELLAPLQSAAEAGLETFAEAYFRAAAEHPEIMAFAAYVLYRSLGPTLPDGLAGAAALWGIAQMYAAKEPASLARAGFDGTTVAAGNKLFEAILESPSGVVFSKDEAGESFRRNRFADDRVNLVVPEMLDEMKRLADYEGAETGDGFPLVLSAGERRSHTANTILRDPAWLKSNNALSLTVSPVDARSLGLSDGGGARLSTARDSIDVVVEVDARMLAGHISLPNGLGLSYPDARGNAVVTGVSANELTAAEHRDEFAGTPFHKFVPAKLEAIGR